MAVINFIPEVWSARLLSALQTTHVARAVTNRDYEGSVTPGGTVHITSVDDVSIGDYTGAEFEFEEMADATRALIIDQQKFFAFQLDDVDRAQAVNGGTLLDESLDRAVYKMADALDKHVLGLMAAGADTTPAEATVTDPGDAYDLLVDYGVLLDESDVPSASRFAVVPPSFHGLILKDNRFIGTGDAQAVATRQNGMVGQAAGFTLYKSNNLPVASGGSDAGNKFVIAGSTIATTVAEQIDKIEAVRLEKKFGDGVKGLHCVRGEGASRRGARRW